MSVYIFSKPNKKELLKVSFQKQKIINEEKKEKLFVEKKLIKIQNQLNISNIQSQKENENVFLLFL